MRNIIAPRRFESGVKRSRVTAAWRKRRNAPPLLMSITDTNELSVAGPLARATHYKWFLVTVDIE